jgi:hypothetical protein
LTVSSDTATTALSPFFAKAGWVLFIDPSTGEKTYVCNRSGSSGWVCGEILGRGARRAVCGFIDVGALRTLADAGVDVRLGSCSSPAESLIGRFDQLPSASIAGYESGGSVLSD